MGLATIGGTRLLYLGDSGTLGQNSPKDSASQAWCYISIPMDIKKAANADTNMIRLYSLPDVSDSKSAFV